MMKKENNLKMKQFENWKIDETVCSIGKSFGHQHED